MNELLCILLHLLVIFSPRGYYQAEIYAYEAQNQSAVNDIRNDPVQLNNVVNEQSEKAQWIDIFDLDETD